MYGWPISFFFLLFWGKIGKNKLKKKIIIIINLVKFSIWCTYKDFFFFKVEYDGFVVVATVIIFIFSVAHEILWLGFFFFWHSNHVGWSLPSWICTPSRYFLYCYLSKAKCNVVLLSSIFFFLNILYKFNDSCESWASYFFFVVVIYATSMKPPVSNQLPLIYWSP